MFYYGGDVKRKSDSIRTPYYTNISEGTEEFWIDECGRYHIIGTLSWVLTQKGDLKGHEQRRTSWSSVPREPVVVMVG